MWLQIAAPHDPAAVDLLLRCGGKIDSLSGRMVVDAAAAGNAAAQGIFARALQTLGWAIAQMITLVCAAGRGDRRRRAVGGRGAVLRPLRREVARYVFPPLAKSYDRARIAWRGRSSCIARRVAGRGRALT